VRVGELDVAHPRYTPVVSCSHQPAGVLPWPTDQASDKALSYGHTYGALRGRTDWQLQLSAAVVSQQPELATAVVMPAFPWAASRAIGTVNIVASATILRARGSPVPGHAGHDRLKSSILSCLASLCRGGVSPSALGPWSSAKSWRVC